MKKTRKRMNALLKDKPLKIMFDTLSRYLEYHEAVLRNLRVKILTVIIQD